VRVKISALAGQIESQTSMSVPYPPLGLANRVCSLEGWGDPIAAYERLGAETKASLLAVLPEDWSFAGKRVLDFGCGAGRTLRQFLAEAERAELLGCDIDAASIDWLNENLCPPLHALQNAPRPPLGLEYGTFDLIWALSVFTHLTDTSLPWLLELHGLLKPEGLLLATYMGRWNGEWFTGEPWDEDRVGMNVLRRNQGWEHGGPTVLMSDWWVRTHWGRAFDILEMTPEVQGQTWALLRKRDVQLTVDDLEKPAEDIREIRALRHNLAQVERDHKAELAAAVADVRREYEGSLSWRITRPLRSATRIARARRARGR
jgi:SAM-dependent methyltransferase